jgi:monovalent cation:H+ antiporter, CPA1 family
MGEFHIIDYAIYIAAFLFGTTLLKIFSQKIAFPYTVALLIIGFVGQFINTTFNLGLHFSLSPDFIFFILLPVLLFESAMRINIHQFKIQFKTITFLATFCLMLSVFFVGVGLTLLLGLPFEIALLFGAIISATDPIAVLALFKTLGAPKRLSLIAEGESMFNDATGVIAFRVISGFIFGYELLNSHTLLETAGSFAYIFLGSILLGGVLGYMFAILLQQAKTDRVLVSAMITALSLGSFAIAEHFFHISGVITTVIAGIVFGNLARGKLTNASNHFLEEYFEYIGFISLSLVFFFASFSLNLNLFANVLPALLVVILVVLVTRALSVYITLFLSNILPFFKDEPNVPFKWQHILNWGGLRGVIPLVLVYSLPDSFIYKEMLLQFTLATLLFTLFVNGLTIRKLLFYLKLHVPTKEEKIMENEMKIFSLEKAGEKLQNLRYPEFTQSVLKMVDDMLFSQESKYKRELQKLSKSKEFIKSLKIQSIEIERKALQDFFEQGRLTEGVLYEFESELDLQRDILEYPDLYTKMVSNKTGEINTRTPFRKRLAFFKRFISKHTLLSRILRISERDIILERYTLLRVRLLTSYVVLDYIKDLENIFHGNKKITLSLKDMKNMHVKKYMKRNQKEINRLSTEYPDIIIPHQQKVATQLISS